MTKSIKWINGHWNPEPDRTNMRQTLNHREPQCAQREALTEKLNVDVCMLRTDYLDQKQLSGERKVKPATEGSPLSRTTEHNTTKMT